MASRDSLDGLLDYNVVSGAMRPYHRMVMDRKRTDGQLVVEYGDSNAVERANTQPAGWCVDASVARRRWGGAVAGGRHRQRLDDRR
ncbi:MAG: hypothetical protein U0736_01735 [Gemmataceae bacterium]